MAAIAAFFAFSVGQEFFAAIAQQLSWELVVHSELVAYSELVVYSLRADTSLPDGYALLGDRMQCSGDYIGHGDLDGS